METTVTKVAVDVVKEKVVDQLYIVYIVYTVFTEFLKFGVIKVHSIL